MIEGLHVVACDGVVDGGVFAFSFSLYVRAPRRFFKEDLMTEQSRFDPKISLGNIIVAISMFVSVVMYGARLDKTNAVQDARIENNLRLIEKGLEAERRQTNVSDEEIKRQMERSQRDVSARLNTMDKKLDKLVGWGQAQ